jgi:type IV pilus assembly protein PilO
MKLDLNVKGIGKKLTKVSRIYKLIFILGINILIFVLLFFFIIKPQFETKKKLLTEYQGIKKDLEKMIAVKNNMEKSRKEYTELQEALKQVLKQLPETKDIPNLLRNVSNVGTETGIKVKYFEPKAMQNKEFYAELPFEIKYSGSYHNIGYFFDGVRKLERIIHIANFSLDSKGTPAKIVLEGSCLAKTYVYLKEQPKPKKEEKKGEKKEGKGAETPKK